MSTNRKRWVIALFAVVVILGSTLTIVEANAASTPPPPLRTVQPGTFAGSAFDTCAAPSDATMTAWKASPYRAIGIYIGGVSRGCPQPNLTQDWVRTQTAAGWHLIPLYVGPQASCSGNTKNLIDNTTAAAQGTAAATDAVAQAQALGLVASSTIVYDMEAYQTTDATCRAGVLAFLSAWTSKLHDLSYFSGFYSSMGSGGADQVANYSAAGYARPDYIDFARWDNVATLTDVAIPAADWAPHRRMKQYQGGHPETWGGVTVNVDSNQVDFAPLPATKMSDFDRNGWSDVLIRTSNTGNLYFLPGNGGAIEFGARKAISSGWKVMNAMLRIGDLNRDGYDDIVARQASTGYLYFYPGRSNGTFGARTLISHDFKRMGELAAIGDLTGDGYPDLVGVQNSDHSLYLYPGVKGGKFGTRKLLVKGGWQTMSELAGVGDFTRDGHPDLIARQTSTGTLYLYPGGRGTLGARRQLATGFAGYRDLVGLGDFDRDGYPDLAGVLSSNGTMVLFRGTGSALLPGVRVSAGFSTFSPLL